MGLPNRINFDEINKNISSYQNIPKELNEISLLFDGKKIKADAIFKFKKGNLCAKISLNKELKLGSQFQASFGQYISNNAYAIKMEINLQNNEIEYKIILDDIYSSTTAKNTKYNIAVFNKHKNIHRLDAIIACSPTNMPFKFCGKNFHMYSIKNDLLAIVCENQMEYQEFSKYIIHSIQTALDFLSSELSGEIIYIFSADLENEAVKDVKHCKIISLAPSASLNFEIFISMNYPMQDAFKDKEMHLSKEQFEKLCALIHSEPQFRTTIYYILESARVSLEFVLMYLSVALESNAKYIKAKDGQKIIDDEEKFKQFKQVVDKAIDGADGLNEDEIKIFKNKITNNIPNSQSLQKPFEKHNITLSKEEMDILNKRNAVLHGKAIEYSDDIMRDVHKYQKEARILYLMLYKVILKMIGYDGYIVNINKWDEIVEFINSYNSNNPKVFKDDFIKRLR